MGRLELVDKGVIFRNPLPGHRVINAFYPAIHPLPVGELLCVLRTGGAMYSPDGMLEVFRSGDGGATWHRQGPIRDRTRDALHYNYLEATVTQLRDETLVMRVMRVDHSNQDLLVFNPSTQGLLPVETCFVSSADCGKTWSDPVVADLRPHFKASLEPAPLGPLVELEDGTWFHVFDTWKSYGNTGPFELQVYGLFSKDRGRTWYGKVPVAVGTAENRSYSHGQPIRLSDGRVYLSLWAAEPQLQSNYGLYAVTSTDSTARSWTDPVPLGIPGQTSAAADLGEGRMLIVYSHRDNTDQPGIKVVLSQDGGSTWDMEEPLVLWDAYGREALGVPKTSTYPSSHDVIAYGAPKITRLGDNTAMACFWCTQGPDTHCRWCKVAIR